MALSGLPKQDKQGHYPRLYHGTKAPWSRCHCQGSQTNTECSSGPGVQRPRLPGLGSSNLEVVLSAPVCLALLESLLLWCRKRNLENWQAVIGPGTVSLRGNTGLQKGKHSHLQNEKKVSKKG